MNRVQPVLQIFLICLAGLALAGCTPFSPPPTVEGAELPDQPPLVITKEVPVTVEVTREVAVVETPTAPGRCSPQNVDDLTELRVGVLLPLSSPGAVQAGNAMQAAFNIAAEHINNEGGVLGANLRIIVEDTQGDPAWGAAKARSLIVEDCVVALTGVYHSRVAMRVKEVAHTLGVPVVFSDPYQDEVTTDQYPEVFRIGPTFSLINEINANWLQAVGDYNEDGQQTVALITENNSGSLAQVEMAAERFRQDETVVETLLVDLPTDNFSSVIARIVALTHIPDVMFIWFNGNSGYAFQQQLGQSGIGPTKGTILVTKQSALDAETFWQLVPGGAYTVVQKSGPWHPTVTEMGQLFVADYRTFFARWPESYAFEAYDSLRLLAHAMDQAHSLAPDQIILALENADVVLASGRYYFPYGSQNAADLPRGQAYMWHQWPDVPLLFLQYLEANQSSAEMAVLWPEIYRTVSTPIFHPLPE